MDLRSERLKLRIVGLDYVSCSHVINRALEGVKGVRKVGVSYMMDLVFVDYDPDIVTRDEIIELVKETGYDAVPLAT